MNTPQRRQTKDNNSDLNKYLNLIIRNWYWFLICLLLSLSIAKMYNILSPRIYSVSCELAIGEKEYASVNSGQTLEGIDFNKTNPINKEIGVLKSKSLAEQAIQALDFSISYYELYQGTLIKRRRYNKLPFVVSIDSSDDIITNKDIYVKILKNSQFEIIVYGEDDIKRKINSGDRFNGANMSFKIEMIDENRGNTYTGRQYLFHYNNFSDNVNKFWRKLHIKISPTSQNILILSLTGENANQAIDYLNKLCELYDENDLKLRNRMASNTIAYIDSQLEVLNEQLVQAEDSLIRFKRRHKIFQTEINSVISEEFIKLDEQLHIKQLQLQSINETQKKLDSIATGGEIVIPLIYASTESRLERSIENINKLVIEREIHLKNQQTGSPTIISINQRIEAEIKAFKSFLNLEKEFLQKEIKRINTNLSRLEKELLNIPAIERQLAKLLRNFELTENLYNLYQQKRIEANLAEASTVSNVRILDPPNSESAVLVSPRKRQNNQTAIVIGLAFPLLLLIVIEMLTNKVRNIQDIDRDLDIPIVGKLSHSRANIYLPAKEYPLAAITESFRTLHAKLKYLLVDEYQKVIAITSGSSGEGKTFCAMNLATVMAGSGKKVLLMGFDLRRPKIHKVFNLDNSTGLTTYLIGNCRHEDIIHTTDQKNLFLINSGPIPPNPVELIEHERMKKLMEKCRKEYDYIILDTPPIGLVADAHLLTKFSDLFLFVIRIDQTKKNIFKLLRELQNNKSLSHLSLIVNDIKQHERYGYRYSNSYYQKEKPITIKERITSKLYRRR